MKINRYTRGMISAKFIFILLIMTIFMNGCVKNGITNRDYIKPDIKQINNSTIIEKPFDKAWDNLVEQLSKSFFTINNIDKQSRIINISFYSNNPNDYISCGRFDINTSRGKESRHYNYDLSENKTIILEMGAERTYFEVDQVDTIKATIEGKINIYVAPIEKNKTKCSVNIRYILTRNHNIIIESCINNNKESCYTRNIPAKTDTFTFTTNQPNSQSFDNASYDINCCSTGKLESEILDMAGR